MGPAVLIAIGLLFLLDQVDRGGALSFHYTWPVILIVMGAISLASATASSEGHISEGTPSPPPPVPPSSLPGQGR